MTDRQQWIVVFAVLGGLAALIAVGSIALRAELTPVDVGSKAPDFEARVVGSNESARLSDYAGNVVLLNIWATWCAPCRVEMPSIERLYREYSEHGLKVLAVSVDQVAGDREISEFANELGLTFDILHDATMRITDIYRVTGYPETFIIDRAGVIRRKWIGEETWDSQGNRSLVAQLLGVTPTDEPAPAGDGRVLEPR